MPTLCMFFGIIITMFREVGGKHHMPHFHAEYQGDVAIIGFNGDVLEGTLPSKKLRQVLVWADLHQEELVANWKLICDGRDHFRIDPLR